MGSKVSRRVALGSIAGGLASATAVLYALKCRYRTTLAQTRGGKMTLTYHGQNINLDVPRCEIKGPDDEKRFNAMVVEQMKKDPKVVEEDRKLFEEWKRKNVEQQLARLDEIESPRLRELAGQHMPEAMTEACAQALRKTTQDAKAKVTKWAAQQRFSEH